MARFSESRAMNAAVAGSVSKRWFTERELSAYSTIATKTLQNWRIRGIGPAWHKLGDGRAGKVVYDIQRFDAWIESRPGGGGVQ